MKHLILSTLASALLTGSPALSQDTGGSSFFYDEANLDAIERISVIIEDNARDGCWTNLGEAKTYAEDQLRLKGYGVIEVTELGDWSFVVGVNSVRGNSGACQGYLEVSIIRYVAMRNISGVLVAGRFSSIFGNPENANILVLERIRKAIDQFPQR